jgi:acyl-CoA synthetase (AMP-forming)/AMP-acid ligase II
METLTAWFGAMRAGMVAVPISFKLPHEAIEGIMADADLELVFHDGPRAQLCPRSLPHVDFDDVEGYANFLDWGDFAKIEPVDRELGMMLYTSGSTGRPKGVQLSHESQRWAVDQLLGLIGDVSHHRYLVAAPMFHMNATFNLKMALRGGASVVLLPSFNALTYARSIERFGVTWLTSVPTMLAMVARERETLGELDLSSVQRVSMGSAPLTQALVDKVQAMFPGALISNSYGTTEAGPCPFSRHPDGQSAPALSCGYPIPGSRAELREGISDDEGVLYLSSPMMMEGYNNLPEKTADVLRDGWYRTGDIMNRDADGFYYFIGRSDDMFVVGGENVWPGEVEKLLEQAPCVHQAIVVPVRDEIKGALPFAFVVGKAGQLCSEVALKAFALANGPAYAHPRFIEVLEEIPLAPTNKPDRSRLVREAERIVSRRRAAADFS